MKKSILLLGLCVSALISCKKDYSCTCTNTDVDSGVTLTTTTNYKVEGATKRQAEAACNEATIKFTEGTYSYTQACKLSK